MIGLRGGMLLLIFMVLLSALGLVYSKYQSRKLFVHLQALEVKRDALNIEWGRLLLEQSTLATPTRVERIARERLGMRAPAPETIVIVAP